MSRPVKFIASVLLMAGAVAAQACPSAVGSEPFQQCLSNQIQAQAEQSAKVSQARFESQILNPTLALQMESKKNAYLRAHAAQPAIEEVVVTARSEEVVVIAYDTSRSLTSR